MVHADQRDQDPSEAPLLSDWQSGLYRDDSLARCVACIAAIIHHTDLADAGPIWC